MRVKNHLAAAGFALLLTVFTFAPQALAQKGGTLTVGKEGMVTFSSSVRAGDVLLKPGMYHVRHVLEGEDHVVSFKPVRMPAGYRQFQMTEGEEVVRVKCRVEPAAKKTLNTKFRLGRNASGERVVEEIQIAGERVRHLL